jgi:hypothetical protein
MLAAGARPLEPYPGTQKPWLVECLTCGEINRPRLNNVRSGQGPCRRCGRARASTAQSFDPSQAWAVMEAAGAEPLEPYPGANWKHWRVCCLLCGAITAPRFAGVRRGKGPCWRCAVAKRAAGLAFNGKEAEAIVRDAGGDPVEPYPGNGRTPWRIRCQACSRVNRPRFDNIRQGRGVCRNCADQKRAAVQRLDETIAVSDMRGAGAEPLEPYPGAAKPWRVRCLICGQEGRPTLNNVKDKGTGPCRRCGAAESARVRMTPEAEAIADMRAAGAEPLEPYPGSSKPWLVRCLSCGNENTPQLASIRQGRGPCRLCAAYGFDPGLPAILYILRHELHRAWKYGVAHPDAGRLEKHRRGGWDIETVIHFASGAEALVAERRVKAWARGNGFGHAVDAREMPQGGWTETLRLADVPVHRTILDAAGL